MPHAKQTRELRKAALSTTPSTALDRGRQAYLTMTTSLFQTSTKVPSSRPTPTQQHNLHWSRTSAPIFLSPDAAGAVRTFLEGDVGVGLSKHPILVGELLAAERHVQEVVARRQLLAADRQGGCHAA